MSSGTNVNHVRIGDENFQLKVIANYEPLALLYPGKSLLKSSQLNVEWKSALILSTRIIKPYNFVYALNCVVLCSLLTLVLDSSVPWFDSYIDKNQNTIDIPRRRQSFLSLRRLIAHIDSYLATPVQKKANLNGLEHMTYIAYPSYGYETQHIITIMDGADASYIRTASRKYNKEMS